MVDSSNSSWEGQTAAPDLAKVPTNATGMLTSSSSQRFEPMDKEKVRERVRTDNRTESPRQESQYAAARSDRQMFFQTLVDIGRWKPATANMKGRRKNKSRVRVR